MKTWNTDESFCSVIELIDQKYEFERILCLRSRLNFTSTHVDNKRVRQANYFCGWGDHLTEMILVPRLISALGHQSQTETGMLSSY